MAIKGMGDDPSAEGGILAEINITPLTDIFLVLLIIFMVTSSVMSQLGVNVDLPKSNPGLAQSQPKGVILTLLPNGSLKINDTAIAAGDWPRMESELKSLFSKMSERLVIIEGDRKSFLGSAIEVMDHARKAGAEKFAIASQIGTEKN